MLTILVGNAKGQGTIQEVPKAILRSTNLERCGQLRPPHELDGVDEDESGDIPTPIGFKRVVATVIQSSRAKIGSGFATLVTYKKYRGYEREWTRTVTKYSPGEKIYFNTLH